MKAFRIRYKDGSFEIKYAQNALELIKKYDLATRDHIETRITELAGEQAAIAFSNLD